MTPPPVPSVHELLHDARWVRGLARSLVRDSHAADDLAQEACLVALQSPPAHDTNVRGWFQRVLGNLVRQQARASKRRVRREVGVAEERAAASAAATDELIERATAHRAVVDAVLQLEPLYRETMLLRWFEEQPPREIAARIGVPVATVHSRLQRGAAQLRTRLDHRFGSRRAWGSAFVPLPLPLSLPTVLPVLGVAVMNAKAIAAGAALAIGAAVYWAVGFGNEPSGPGAVDARSVVAQVPAAPPDGGASAPAEAVRQAVPTPASNAANGSKAPLAANGRLVQGRVIDGDGRAAASVTLRLDDVQVAGDAAGAFELSIGSSQGGIVRADDTKWCTVMHGVVAADSVAPVLVVVGPAVPIAGEVRGPRGEVVAAAQVSVGWPLDLRSRLSGIADTSAEERLATKAAADGKFTLTTARIRGAELLVVAEGYLPHRRPLPEQADSSLRIVLEVPIGKPGTLQGQVVDGHGAAIAGARVGMGSAVVRSDERGNFLIDDDGESPLAATALGHRRGLQERPSGGYPPFVLLTLGGAPLTICGRVVDASGAGIAGAKVWCTDSSLLCASRELYACEGIASGAITLNELREKFERGELQDPQRVLRTTATAAWPWVLADAEGNFVLGGLEDRKYSLRAMEADTLLRHDVPGVAAGSAGVRIELPTQAQFARIAGTVVTGQGVPMKGVTVVVQADTQSLKGTTMHERSVARAVTGVDGRFELSRVPHRNVYLRLDGDNILPLEHGRGVAGGLFELAAGRPEDLRLEVRARMHVQVELLDVASADAIAVLDGDGKAVSLTVFLGRGRNDTDRLVLAEGRSPVFVVPDTAATLVLYRGDAEVRRQPLQLRPGDVNTMRL